MNGSKERNSGDGYGQAAVAENGYERNSGDGYERKSVSGDAFGSGRPVIAVELDPPADDDAGFFLEGVRTIRDAGADLITIADCPVGRPRADSCVLAAKIKREYGIESLPHMTCRDRNLNAMRAALLALSIEGVHHILLVTGDPIPREERENVKPVFQVQSRQLARIVQEMNETVFHTPFRIFGALNVNASQFERELERAAEKEECGVTGFLTQPIHSPEALENLKIARKTLRGVLLGGVFPIISRRNAEFLNENIAGIRVSPDIIALYDGKDREESERVAVELSLRTAKSVGPYADGLYLMTPFRRTALMAEIVRELRRPCDCGAASGT